MILRFDESREKCALVHEAASHRGRRYAATMKEQKIEKLLCWLLAPERIAPDLIPRSGPRAEAVDCYCVEIQRNGQPYLMLRAVEHSSVIADEWSGTRFEMPRALPMSDIQANQVVVTHFIGTDELAFNDLGAFLWARRLRGPYIARRLRRGWNGVAQWLFNKRDLAAGARLAVLREVVHAVGDGAQGVDAFGLMSLRHGDRWVGHPSWKAHRRALNHQLAGLVDTGELRRSDDGNRFIPTGQAYRTLEESDDTDRKHRDNFRLQVVIGLLTFVGAFMGAIQAGVVKLPTLLDLTAGTKCEASKDGVNATSGK